MVAIAEYPDFDIAGCEQTRTMLLLHGTGVTRKMWMPQMAALGEQYRCIAPDLPGHGSRSKVGFSFDATAEYLKDVLEDNGCQEALLLGWDGH